MINIVELRTGAEWALSAAYTSVNTERIVVDAIVFLLFMAVLSSASRHERTSSVPAAELYLLKWGNTHFGNSCLFRLSISEK